MQGTLAVVLFAGLNIGTINKRSELFAADFLKYFGPTTITCVGIYE